MDEVTTKPVLGSKTMGFAALLIALGLSILTSSEFAAVIEALPTEYSGIATIVVGLIVAILRGVTSSGISGVVRGKFQ